MLTRVLLSALVAALAASAQVLVPRAIAQAPARRPMVFEDLMKMRRLGDISVSPDGKWVLYTATGVDLGKNTKTSHLFLISAGGGDSTALMDSAEGERRGRFSPDGKQVLFQRTREGGQQIYIAPFNAQSRSLGDPRQLTTLSTGADGAMWSPDGQSVLFTSAVYPDCSLSDQDACDKQRDDALAASQVKAKIFTHLLYRHWNAYNGDKRSHLFVVPASGGTPRDLNPGDDHDVPPFSLGGPDAYAFAPDSKEIAFEEDLDPVAAISTHVDIFTLRLDDPAAKPVKISTSLGGNFSPAYSPDGRNIAFRSQARAGYESDKFRLVLYDRQSKQLKDLLPDFDRWVGELAWAHNSSSIYFVAENEGAARIFRADLEGALSMLTSKGEYGDLHPLWDGEVDGERLFATRMTVAQPAEVCELTTRERASSQGVTPAGQSTVSTNASNKRLAYPPSLMRYQPGSNAEAAVRQLTHLNDALLAELDLAPLESFWFPSIGGVRAQGFLVKPPAFDPRKKYPVKFLIHGGPQGAWGDSWSYRWNAELFAASGYVVVMINPRGSTGYGQAFIDGINGDWGGKPYIDLMRGLDYAELHFPFIDKTRECALGASYGGYMANWILGHTDRFKCIVSHDGMFNPEAAYGSTEELWFNEWEFRGKPWDYYGRPTALNPYRRWSPALYAKNFKTPTLVIHGQLDYRLDVSQGFDLFTTLQRLNVPSKMLYFPDEGHWVLKPQNSQLWNRTVSDWVDQWTKNEAKPADALKTDRRE
ncbi:MAG TPA: S9 family peptidase [Acidisarcina sp.]